MTSVFKALWLMAGTALVAAGPAVLPDRQAELIIRNLTDTDCSLQSTPPEDAGALVIRTTLATWALPPVERVPDGQAEIIELPARSTVVIDCRDPFGTTWRKFWCRRAGSDPGEASPVWYRVPEDGDRTVHAHDTWWGLEKTNGNTISLRTPDPVMVLLSGPGCAIL